MSTDARGIITHRGKLRIPKRHIYVVFRNLAFAIVVAVFVVPFWGFIATSISDAPLSGGQVRFFPVNVSLRHFSQLFERMSFMAFVYNSAYVAFYALIGQVVVSVLAAFAFGRQKFPGQKIVMSLVVSTLIMTETMLMIPLYLTLRELPLIGINLLGTRAGMILPLIGWAFPIVVLTEFVKDIPRDFDDSARVDGATEFTIYTRILLPLILPALGTCVIFGFVMIWNQYALPLIVSPDFSLMTLPVILRNIRFAMSAFENVTPMWMAGAVITMMPSILVYFLLQRSFVEGLSRGGVKG